MVLRSAREWGQTPLAMLTGEVDKGWEHWRNRLLALALTQYEATLCGGCGLPMNQTTEDDTRLDADSVHCRGCQMLHDAQGEHDKPGTRYYVALAESAD